MKELLLGLIMLLTQLVEAVTGFGSSVLALPFVTMLFGLTEAVQLLVVSTFLMCGYIAVRERRQIRWRVYLVMIALVGAGMPLGMWVFSALDETALKRVLGCFTVLVGLRGLIARKPAIERKQGRILAVLRHTALFAGGVVHGAFGCGGPLIVLYAAGALSEKRHFRATLCLIWTTLNAVHCARYIATGALSGGFWRLLLISAPFILASIWIGNRIHKKVSGDAFLKIVYAVLLGSGIFMFF